MKELETTFLGRGEVRSFKFRQIARTDAGYLYEVRQPGLDTPHFEAFRRRINERFGVVRYPRAAAFGKWAYAYKNITEASAKLSEISEK